MGGFALQEASREYGMKKDKPRKKRSVNSGSLALENLMMKNDTRTNSSRKKHVPRFTHSCPSHAQKSKASKKRHEKTVREDRRVGKKHTKQNNYRLQELQSSQNKFSGSHKVKDKRGSGQKGSYANQPVSFVSSGMIHSESVPVTVVEAEETYRKGVTNSANIGSFEEHTTGFGSKIMAKMGYMEGGGLGKNGHPILNLNYKAES
ncbi:zinc finger CCCH domain-containing protein 22-like [Vigna angularis]|uniref:zinc finger CCCH domain-containing protein 22-like n=1 Tax=Phaseolus angularis TaxID=3914 RepID=UPI0022B4B060|nr:zinc finger CCCH domain-containing protein 22-like [Vigna angularis]